MDLQEKLSDLIIVDDPLKIRKTADVLEGLKYSPTLLSDFPDFLRTDSRRFFREVEELLREKAPSVPGNLPEGENPETFREKQISLLIYHYKLLNRLRRDETSAWDEVNELMEDD